MDEVADLGLTFTLFFHQARIQVYESNVSCMFWVLVWDGTLLIMRKNGQSPFPHFQFGQPFCIPPVHFDLYRTVSCVGTPCHPWKKPVLCLLSKEAYRLSSIDL